MCPAAAGRACRRVVLSPKTRRVLRVSPFGRQQVQTRSVLPDVILK